LEFFATNSIYIVLFIVLVIWGGIFAYLFQLDKRMKNIEMELKETTDEE